MQKWNWKSDSSVSIRVNHLQTRCLHPSVLHYEIHYSWELIVSAESFPVFFLIPHSRLLEAAPSSLSAWAMLTVVLSKLPPDVSRPQEGHGAPVLIPHPRLPCSPSSWCKNQKLKTLVSGTMDHKTTALDGVLSSPSLDRVQNFLKLFAPNAVCC